MDLGKERCNFGEEVRTGEETLRVPDSGRGAQTRRGQDVLMKDAPGMEMGSSRPGGGGSGQEHRAGEREEGGLSKRGQEVLGTPSCKTREKERPGQRARARSSMAPCPFLTTLSARGGRVVALRHPSSFA